MIHHGQNSKQYSLALGGGGVKGLAHIPLLKCLDRYHAAPALIAGTSMGAIIGALYAVGLSGLEIEARVRDHILDADNRMGSFFKKRKQLMKWMHVFSFDKQKGGFIVADGLFEHLFTELIDRDFSDLRYPFVALATDFHTGESVAMDSGSVLTAVKASIAVPGIFAPVARNGRLLIDGGVVNNVPTDIIGATSDITIASDVINVSQHPSPSASQVLVGAMHIMLQAATRHQLERFPVDIMFTPNTFGIDAFDFHAIGEVLRRGEEAIAGITSDLDHYFGRRA